MSYPNFLQNRFVVSANQLTPDIQRRFAEMLTASGAGWWNWIPGCWLIVDPERKWTASDLRNTLMQLAPGQHVLVLSVASGSGWAAAVPQDGLDWMNSTWK